MSNWGEPSLIDIPTYADPLGSLSVIEGSEVYPHEIKRIYFLHNVPGDVVRGSHAHKGLYQLMIALSGSVEITLDNGSTVRTFTLESPTRALYVPPGLWRTLSNFSSDAVLIVLASDEFDQSDYIRDYDEFVDWTSNR